MCLVSGGSSTWILLEGNGGFYGAERVKRMRGETDLRAGPTLAPLGKGGRASGQACGEIVLILVLVFILLVPLRGMGLASSPVDGTRGGDDRRAGPPLAPP